MNKYQRICLAYTDFRSIDLNRIYRGGAERVKRINAHLLYCAHSSAFGNLYPESFNLNAMKTEQNEAETE